jgi:hypothetical protein
MNVLKCSGRQLVDSAGAVQQILKGFNVQPAGWPAQAYVDMRSFGARFVRTMVFWDQIEPSAGSINMSYVTGHLDVHVQRLAAAGLYTELCLYYGPGGVHCPGWVGGSKMGNYIAHGQNVTQFLAGRYGSNPAVMGFGLNEVTPDTSDSGWLIKLLGQQGQMVDWFRPKASNWIGFYAPGYGAFAPFPNAPGSGHTSDQTFKEPTSNPMRPNCLLDLHVYAEATTQSGSKPVWDGRASNGSTPHPPIINVETSTPYPPTGVSRAQAAQTLAAFIAPHVAFSKQWGVPLCIGECGFPVGKANAAAYAADLAAAIKGAGAAIASIWDYNTSSSNDKWAARNGGAWQPFAVGLFGAI